MAEGDTVGIGSWLCTKNGLDWFSAIWSVSEVREVWPQLRKDAEKYIACFETLAQLALLQMADNTPTEAAVNKLFSTAWPLSFFLRLVASWSHAHSVAGSRPLALFRFSLGQLPARGHRSASLTS